MKPAPFTYLRAGTVDEAVGLLAQHGEDAKILAGGQSLIPLLNMRLARPSVLVDVNRVEGLDGVRTEGEALVIGALTRHRTLLSSKTVAEACPMLAEAAALVGHEAIRSRGTFGGSIAHADPAAELPMVAVATRGEVVLRSTSGRRTVPADAFFLGYFMTAAEPAEMVEEVRIPLFGPRSGSAVEEFSIRSGDFALVASCAALTLDGDGRVQKAGVGVAGASAAPVPAPSVEAALAGASSLDAVKKAAEAVVEDIDPEDDLHATAAYRTRLARVLTERALTRAWNRARSAGEV